MTNNSKKSNSSIENHDIEQILEEVRAKIERSKRPLMSDKNIWVIIGFVVIYVFIRLLD